MFTWPNFEMLRDTGTILMDLAVTHGDGSYSVLMTSNGSVMDNYRQA